jgi:prophage regulatory protein
MTNQINLPDAGFIRLKDLLKIIPVSKSTIYSWVKQNKFPKPAKINGSRASGFYTQEIKEFINHL